MTINDPVESTRARPLDETGLSSWLADDANDGLVGFTRLEPSDRVIARVTDGIYRHPASALRELIANAWDADANTVTIFTDAPRFSRIVVRDDGRGMSNVVFARLLKNIGGSAKRQAAGQKIGVSSKYDVEQSPGGRPLIGKIGIGLFSISQLARRFRIITKEQGSHYRITAEIQVRAYSEDPNDDEHREGSDSFVNGEVFITREQTDDLAAHGTDIFLEDLKPRVRDLLRSHDRWKAVIERERERDRAVVERRNADADMLGTTSLNVSRPRFHSGWIENAHVNEAAATVLAVQPALPWDAATPPGERMARLMDAVAGEKARTERPDLAHTLDTYLQTIWTLALSAPVPYIDTHPFDITGGGTVRVFWLSDVAGGQATELTLNEGETVRAAVRRQVEGAPDLRDGVAARAGDFRVFVDDIELRRPVRFDFSRPERRGLEQALLFVGCYSPNLERVARERRGGRLSLEGYMFWNGRVIPKENNGVLVRIRGASGANFDPTFFQYQVSEQTRLRQITSELFIQRGLDAALNIDRESFNFSHPHVQLVASWVHRSLRQLTNKHKDLSKRLRDSRREIAALESEDALSALTTRIWMQRNGDEPLPVVRIVAAETDAIRSREEGVIAYARKDMQSLRAAPPTENKQRERQVTALARVLTAFGVLDDRSYAEQQELLDAVLSVFYPPSDS